jgi:hypothetical protein
MNKIYNLFFFFELKKIKKFFLIIFNIIKYCIFIFKSVIKQINQYYHHQFETHFFKLSYFNIKHINIYNIIVNFYQFEKFKLIYL